MELSRKLANYITSTTYDTLPEEVISFTKLCILDYFSSAIAGVHKPPIHMIDQMVKELGGKEQASLVTGGKSSVTNAALVNGASSHIVELDDIHKGSIMHAATVVLPAALAISEWKQLNGKDLITAVVVGYEVCYRIGEAVTPSHYYFWHNTATCGTFGATAAAAQLLGLTEKQTVQALGSAGTQAAGFWEFIEDGAMSKQLHPGKAAMNGVISALLAEKGFTGAATILEGDRGFFKAMSTDYKESKVTNQLGETFKIMENSFKIHASCRHTHHVMDLAIALMEENSIPIQDITEIDISTYQVAIDITDNPEPATVYAAKFSIQYCTALSLVKGQGGIDDFNEEILWDEEIRTLIQKIKVSVDPIIDRAYPSKWGATLTLKQKNGNKITKKTDFPKGDPENPVTEDELVSKFKQLTDKLPDQKQLQLIYFIKNLEETSSISDIMDASI